MNCKKIDNRYLEQSIALVLNEYENQKVKINMLPSKSYSEKVEKLLTWIFSKELVYGIVEDEKLEAFISFIPLETLFGKVKGAFAPMGASYFGEKDRYKVCQKLFKCAAEDMIKQEILSYGIAIYARDTEVLRSFSMNGFGYRCCDGVRNLEEDLKIIINEEIEYEEVAWERAQKVLPLHNQLHRHLTASPVFLKCKELSEKEWQEELEETKNRFFVAKDDGKIIGFLRIGSKGETFITGEEDYRHICGAYLKEEYRGKNIMQSLLKIVCDKLKCEGVKELGVDCETINPEAISFWEKHFQSYIYSLTRRIDERVL